MEVAYLNRCLYDKPLGRLGVRYDWVGDHDLPLRVTSGEIREIVPSFDGNGWPQKIEIDGIPLQYLPGSEKYETTFLWDAALYKRIDGINWFGFIYWILRRRLRMMFWFLYERFILTLHVWGLADYPEGQRVSWRDIKLFHRK